jgi:peptidoglycan/xylan/chitin deacetylase (PgdA/CDA1 family)
MRDSFDYATYWALLARIAETHRIVRFNEMSDGDDTFCILRHDIDYSPSHALRLAEKEAKRGIRATYFLLAASPYYNLLAPEHAHVARALAELGHEVGLHYDVRSFLPYPREEWPRLLRAQAALLGELSGRAVTSIAMHQPALHGSDPFAHESLGFTNAYDAQFTVEATYVSDSCRAWRDNGWAIVSGGALPPRLHLCLHPINWSETDRDRVTIFRDVHEQLLANVAAARDELLAQIACHTGVLEHDARTRGER